MATGTAALATGDYVPPFAGQTLTTAAVNGATQIAATTAAAAGITFASVAQPQQQTNTFTATDSNGHAWSTSNGLTTDNYEDYFLIPYLQAHELSWPSYRYAYILWIMIAGLMVVWSILHAIFRGHGGVISALTRKAALRRFEFGSSGETKTSDRRAAKTGHVYADYGPPRERIVHRAKYATPTVGQIGSCILILLTVFCVSYVNSDYLSPTECLFGGICTPAVSQGPPETTFRLLKARTIDLTERAELPAPAHAPKPRAVEAIAIEIAKRAGVYATQRLNPSGWAPFNDPLLAGTNTAISKSYWTSSARTGLIAYALVPLVVTLALKLWPYAIFGTPFLTNYSFDKTAIFHRWIGRLIWALSTVHVGLWTKQLLINTDPYGRYIWYEVWQYWRFRAGVVGYAALTAMVLLSFNPLRSRYYEVFYWTHVATSIIFMVGCMLHFYNLQWWLIAGLAIWGAERFTRFAGWLHINGLFRGIGLFGKADVMMRERRSKPYTEKRGAAYSPAAAPGLNYAYSHPNAAQSEATINDPYGYRYDKSGLTSPNQSFYGQLPHTPNAERDIGVAAQTISPPEGYAVAQLLPGRTVRLTFRPPTPVHWRPGQHTLVTIPAVRLWQSHPYTLANADGSTLGEPRNDMVFLIRARKGFSLDLYKHVASMRRAHGAGVLVRTQIGFTMGSAGRAHWGEYKTVFLVVGGTGVSFGIGVFDYVCRAMAVRNTGSLGQTVGRPFKTTQIHFLWILREWAHLAWIAPTVHRCLQISRPGAVRVSLYIASSAAMPKTPGLYSQSNESGYPFDRPPQRPPRPDEMESLQVDSALDYVLFDGEESQPTADETAASSTVRRAGTLRKNKRRTQAAAAPTSSPAAADRSHEVLYPPRPPLSPIGMNGPRSSSPARTPFATPQSTRVAPWASHDRRNSNHSLASEATLSAPYEDPYGGEMKQSWSQRSLPTTPFRERPAASPSASAVALSLKGDADEALLDVAGPDRESLDLVAELAIEGRPQVDQVFRDEINRADGSVIVGCCGPTSLNVYMRRLVASAISPGKIRRGDQRGNIDIVCEDYE